MNGRMNQEAWVLPPYVAKDGLALTPSRMGTVTHGLVRVTPGQFVDIDTEKTARFKVYPMEDRNSDPPYHFTTTDSDTLIFERANNGELWMWVTFVNMNGKIEGWVPAVYVTTIDVTPPATGPVLGPVLSPAPPASAPTPYVTKLPIGVKHIGRSPSAPSQPAPTTPTSPEPKLPPEKPPTQSRPKPPEPVETTTTTTTTTSTPSLESSSTATDILAFALVTSPLWVTWGYLWWKNKRKSRG